MKNTCQLCNKTFVGRSDKKYCSLDCKNKLNNKLRSSQQGLIQIIDTILHRNHHILSVLFGNEQKKMMIQKIILMKAGFDFTHFTGTYMNSQNKLYHYIYDFAWMEFSDQQVLIVRQKKSS